MKVLILGNDAHYLYNTRYELVQKLLEIGHNVEIVCADGLNREKFEKLGVAMHLMDVRRHSKNPLNDILIYRNYNKLIKKINPDLVFTFNIKPNVYGGMVCRIKKIAYMPNITGLGTAVEYPGLMQKITVFLYKRAMKNADCIFFQNTANKQFFEQHGIHGKSSRMLPGSGVNLEKFKLLPYPGTEEIHFMFIARILKEKGIDQYIEAAEEIKKCHDNVVFDVIGQCDDDKYINILKNYNDRGIIIYHGVAKNTLEFQKFNSCMVLPSYYPEGMNNVLLESAACGRPIITTDRSGCGEIVDDGVNGYIVNKQDSHDLIEKIERFLNLSYDERRRMGLNGRQKIEKEFDRRLVVEAYIEEINKKFSTKN